MFILEATVEALECEIDVFPISRIQRIRMKRTRESLKKQFPKRGTRCSNSSLRWQIIARFGWPKIEGGTFA